MSIDLAKPRVFAFQERGRNYTITCQPISKDAWLKYFAGIVSTTARNEDGEVNEFDSSSARLQLLEESMIDAAGFTPEGTPIATVDGWRQKLPLKYRRAAADLLSEVGAITPDADEPFELGFEVVLLAAVWTANEEGRMQQVTGLKHVLRSPTAKHQQLYSRAMSRSVVSGEGRTGVTRWMGAQDTLITIYDELYERAEGYVVDGVEVAPAELLPRIDAYHKVAAASALFNAVVPLA